MLLRVMTYNIFNGGNGHQRYIREVIEVATPDVVVLQEVCDSEFVVTLANDLNMDYFIAPGNTKWQLAVLSHLPIASRNSYHPFPPIFHSVLEAEIEYAPSKHLSIFGVHSAPFPIIFFELWRLWEIHMTIRHIKSRSFTACVVLGDFNAIRSSDKVSIDTMHILPKLMIVIQGFRVYRFAISAMIRAGFIDCFRQLHSEDVGFTAPLPKPNARLDYIFTEGDLKSHLLECFIVRKPASVVKASDHYPLMAEFES